MLALLFLGLIPIYTASAQKVELKEGQQLFTGVCHRCHPMQPGEPGKIGPYIRHINLIGFLTGLWNQGQAMLHAFETAGWKPPQLSNSNIMNIYFFTQVLNSAMPEGQSTQGEVFFTQNQCAHCHSIGNEPNKVGPNLGKYMNVRHPLILTTAVWSHRSRMLQIFKEKGLSTPRVKPGDLANLVAYLRTKSTQTDMNPMYVHFSDLTMTEELFAKKGCADCHKPEEFRDRPSRTIYEISETLFAHAFKPKLTRPPYDKITLTSKETLSLVLNVFYYNHLGPKGDPVRGRKVFEHHLCMECHDDPQHPDPESAKVLIQPVTNLSEYTTRVYNKLPLMIKKSQLEGKAFPRLTYSEIVDTFAYLCSISKNCTP